MTLFAKFGIKSGIRPALLCAVFVSFATSTALAGNPTSVPKGHGVKKHAAKTANGYTPRKRINSHPRNRNRSYKTYKRGGKLVRVVDTSKGGFVAPKRSSKPTERLAFRKHPTDGVSFDNRYERLVLRYLRESIDAAEFDNARRRADIDMSRRDGLGRNGGGAVYVDQLQEVPILPGEGLLTEVANDGPLRPRAEIIEVSEQQRILGEQRAAARARRFNREGGNVHFRFYRPNEAYDARFPSIVYLNSK